MYINPNVEVREAVEFGTGVPPQSLSADTVYQSDWKSIETVRRAVAIGTVENLADAKTLHVYFQQATDSSGSNAKDLGDEVTVTADGEQDVMAIAEIYEQDLDTEGGFDYIAASIYHDDDSADNGAVVVGEVPYRRDGDIVTTEALDAAGSGTTSSV